MAGKDTGGSSSSSSSSSEFLLSAGLFLATALASQWLQHHMRNHHGGADDDYGDNNNNSQLRHYRIKAQRQRIRRQREIEQQQNPHSKNTNNNRGQRKEGTNGFFSNHQDGGDGDDEDDVEGGDAGYQEDDDPTNSDPRAEFRDYYRMRRVENRLSFENLRPLVHEAQLRPDEVALGSGTLPENPALTTTTVPIPSLGHPVLTTTTEPIPSLGQQPVSQQQEPQKHESTLQSYLPTQQQQQQQQQQISTSKANSTCKAKKPHHHRPLRRRHRDSVIDREDEYDFLPKNSNWNHFERYNEDDLKDGVVTPASDQQYHHHEQHHYQAFSHGYMHETGTMDASVQSSVSPAIRPASGGGSHSNNKDDGESSDTSEEPQFVWTEALHEKKNSSLKNKAERAAAALGVPLKPIEYEQPVIFQPTTLPNIEPTAEAELPGPNRPERLMTVDSGHETLPAGNRYNNEDVNKSPPSSSDASSPLEGISNTTPSSPSKNNSSEQQQQQHRQFLRHANSIGASSSQKEQEKWLPQRFPPPPMGDRVGKRSKLYRSASGESATSNSDLSAMSESSRHQQNNLRRSSSGQQHHNESSHRSARAQYNAKIMPNKVVMIRHGQSMGNINEDLYSTTPDNAMPLTKLGWEQARKAGKHLKENVLAPLESVHFIVSPYARTVETFHGIVSAWCDPDSPDFASIPNREMRLKAWYGRLLEMGLTWHEDPRIREQDFGNYQDPELIRKAKRDRHRFGIFYYRFPHGESASDVFDRVSTFLDSLWRSFDMNRSRNYVLVTHGISIRVLLARYFRYTIHQFNMLANPRNCEMIVLGHDGCGRLRLQGRYQLHLKEQHKTNGNKIATNGNKGKEQQSDDSTVSTKGADVSSVTTQESDENSLEVDEYKFYKRLRILPQNAIRKVDIRISYNDGASKDASSVT